MRIGPGFDRLSPNGAVGVFSDNADLRRDADLDEPVRWGFDKLSPNGVVEDGKSNELAWRGGPSADELARLDLDCLKPSPHYRSG